MSASNFRNASGKPVSFVSFGVRIDVPVDGEINVHTYPGYGTGITVRQSAGRKGRPVMSSRVDAATGQAVYATMLADATKAGLKAVTTGGGQTFAQPDFATLLAKRDTAGNK